LRKTSGALIDGAAAPIEVVSHYLFRDRFGRPGKGNDKGKVEGLVKYARANFMTPIPVASSYEGLNAMLSKSCVGRQSDRAGRHREMIGESLVADIAALADLLGTRFWRSGRAAAST
jgi:hypothetical protein